MLPKEMQRGGMTLDAARMFASAVPAVVEAFWECRPCWRRTHTDKRSLHQGPAVPFRQKAI